MPLQKMWRLVDKNSSLQAGSKWPFWRSEVTEVDAELKEDQTISSKEFLKLKYRSLSQYVCLFGSFKLLTLQQLQTVAWFIEPRK